MNQLIEYLTSKADMTFEKAEALVGICIQEYAKGHFVLGIATGILSVLFLALFVFALFLSIKWTKGGNDGGTIILSVSAVTAAPLLICLTYTALNFYRAMTPHLQLIRMILGK